MFVNLENGKKIVQTFCQSGRLWEYLRSFVALKFSFWHTFTCSAVIIVIYGFTTFFFFFLVISDLNAFSCLFPNQRKSKLRSILSSGYFDFIVALV